jgi:hypothetical protein
MSRKLAYFSSLKFYFAAMLLEGIPKRVAYASAKMKAASYAFSVSSEHLKFVSL